MIVTSSFSSNSNNYKSLSIDKKKSNKSIHSRYKLVKYHNKYDFTV